MSEMNSDKEKKRGFLPWISNLFKGKTPMARGGMGSASGAAGRGASSGLSGASGLGGRAAGLGAPGLGGASSGLGSAGTGLAGLFATKAGIVGMVLGGATIAAGIGVIYNFIGPSSKPGYTPQLFQNAYLDEQAQNASMDRSKQRNASVDGSLDMFKEQAKKDGLALGEEPAAEEPKTDEAVTEGSADGSAEAPGGPGVGAGANPLGGGAKLQAAGGFGSKGGGGGTSIPAMSGGGGGMFGGVNGKFASVYKSPAKAKTSGMTAKAAGIVGGAKYSVPASKKGAYGQAKFAGKMGGKAAYSADGAGARTAATEAFSGETTGTGDVGTPGGGTGMMGGAGMSSGNKLKANDPSVEGSSFTPPEVPEPEDISPWNDLRDEALKYILIGMGLVLVTKILGKLAKTLPWMYYVALATAIAAMLAGLKVILVGIKLWKGDPNGNPPWTGQMGLAIPMILAGVVIIIQAWNALCDMAGQKDVMGKTTSSVVDGKTVTTTPIASHGAPEFMQGLGGMGLGNVLGGM